MELPRYTDTFSMYSYKSNGKLFSIGIEYLRQQQSSSLETKQTLLSVFTPKGSNVIIIRL